MKNRYDIELFYELLLDAYENLEQNTDFSAFFYDAYFKGERTLYQKEFTERKKFSDDWILTIESYFPSIDRITRNMRSQIKYEEEILPIEKVKRVNSQSIRHLSTNTQFLREIDSEGTGFVPIKILSDQSETEYGIYENRFIMTLVFRLKDYIFERIKIIKQGLYANRKMHFNSENRFSFGDSEYKLNVDIEQSQTFVQRKVDEHNLDILERAEHLYKLINNLTNSTFIKTIRKYKKVNSPIMKTQVILKNHDFKNAYFLWMYLDQNFQLDFDLEASSVNKRFTPFYNKSINRMILTVLSTFVAHNKLGNEIPSEDKPIFKEVSSKILKELPGEFVLNEADSYIIENQVMNEYYINQMARLLKKNIEDNENENGTIKISIKKALEDAIVITNSIFESHFKYNQDEDVFKRLIIDKDPISTLNTTYEKQKVATLVREIKEKDFIRSIELEHKWNLELSKRQQALLKLEQSESDERIVKAIKEEKDKYQLETATQISNKKREYQKRFKDEKKELTTFRKKLILEYKTKSKKLKDLEKKKMQQDKERIKKAKLLERKRLIKKQSNEFKKKFNDIKKEKEILEKTYQKEIDDINMKLEEFDNDESEN